MEALQFVAPQRRQHPAGGHVLHALRHQLQAQRAAQRNDGARDGHVRRIGEQFAHEGAVDLELVDVEALEVRQAGIAGAKVIDRQMHPQRLQRRQLLLRRVCVVHELRLGNFQLQRRGRHAQACQHRLHVRHQLRIGQLRRREIHRHHRAPQGLGAGAGSSAPAHPLRTRFLQHPGADGANQPGLFGDMDELGRRHQAQRGVCPAQQRLHADQLAVLRPHPWLVVQ